MDGHGRLAEPQMTEIACGNIGCLLYGNSNRGIRRGDAESLGKARIGAGSPVDPYVCCDII